MTDFNIVTMAQCAETYVSVEGSDRTYSVGPFGDERAEPRCDCKGFQFHRKCWHLKEAEERWCGYHELIDGPPKAAACPKCGGPVKYVNVAV